MDTNQHSATVIPFPQPKRRRAKHIRAPGEEDPDAKLRAIYLRAAAQYLDEIPRQRAGRQLVRSMRRSARNFAMIAIAQNPVAMLRRLERESQS